MRGRDLTWDGCLNVRDLGGHRTADGRETRFERIIRADSVRQLSEQGWRALVDYGVRTIVDLRGDHERADDPPRDAPVDVLHVPFMEANQEEWDDIEEELRTAVERAPDPAAANRDIYLIFLERFRPNVGAAVRAVAHAQDGGVVIHCVGGKDRTGLLTALLLQTAGVATADIAADYALSEERLRPREEAFLAAAETDAEREEIRRSSRTPAATMVGCFAELERRHGSVAAYLRAAGAGDDDLVRVRGRLLE